MCIRDRGSNGIIAIDTDQTQPMECIKCGRGVDVCPMELSPRYFAKFADEQNWQGMKDMNVMDCVECRSCEFICSSKIPLVSKIKAGKNAIREMKWYADYWTEIKRDYRITGGRKKSFYDQLPGM